MEIEPTTPDAARIAYRAEVRGIATRAALPSAWADEMIDADLDLVAVKAAAHDAMQARPRHTIRAAVGVSSEDPAVQTRRMVEALAADAAGVPVTDAGANQFRGMGFRGLIRAAVEGEPGARYMSDAAALEVAMTRSGGPSLTTADAPLITLGVGNRVVQNSYQEAASPVESALVTYGTAPDFRPVSEIQRGSVGNLLPLSENGEIQAVSFAEAGTAWKLGTYAARIDLTRTMILNDDLALFGNLSADLGRAARRTETAAIIALLVANAGAGPIMADTLPLFATGHANVAATGAALSEATLSAAIQAVQAQRGIGGEILGIRPAYLVVSPAGELVARKLLAIIAPGKMADVNPLAGLLELIVEPRLSGGAWFLFAKPSTAPVLKVGHLAGQRGPIVQQQERWNGLGTSFRVFTDFGVTAIDWRGAYRNGGAA